MKRMEDFQDVTYDDEIYECSKKDFFCFLVNLIQLICLCFFGAKQLRALSNYFQATKLELWTNLLSPIVSLIVYRSITDALSLPH